MPYAPCASARRSALVDETALAAPEGGRAEPEPPPARPASGRLRRAGRASVLLLLVAGATTALATWKEGAAASPSAAPALEPMEAITAALAEARAHRPTTSSIGTVRALRSITLENEVAGTVREVALRAGEIVDEGALLVALDVRVEEAELEAQEARAELADALLGRLERANLSGGAAEADVDRARAERDVARAEIERIRAVIERKTLRAPFRARVGLADLHPGQYLDAGTPITTLQGLDDAVHVDFSVNQSVADRLRAGERVEVVARSGGEPVPATVVAVDARVDPSTRNALVRARLDGTRLDGTRLDGTRLDGPTLAPAPGASVRVRVPVGPERTTVAVPVSALRKSPSGDHVFVIEPDGEGRPRAHVRPVVAGVSLGNEVVIEEGLEAGEQVAAAGSFKLREAVLVAVAGGELAE